MATILIALDGSGASRSAVDTTLAVCSPGSSLLLFTVLPPPHETPEQYAPLVWHFPGVPTTPVRPLAETREQAIDRLHAEAVDRLGLLAGELSERGYDTTVGVAFGEPVKEILARADAVGADLIAVATHGRSPIGAVVLGSVASALIHSHRFPVLVAPRADV